MATTKITSAAGLRRVQAFKLDVNGVPSDDESGANGYDGIQVSGAQSFQINAPDAQIIPFLGDDVLFAQMFLPPTTGVSATLNTQKNDMDALALFTNTSVETINSDIQMAGNYTSNQGNEQDVALLITRNALDTDNTSTKFGSQRWQTYIVNKGNVFPKGASIEQNAAEVDAYNVVMTPTSVPPWQKSFTNATNGYTTAQYLVLTSEYPITMEKYTGNGTLTTFNTTFTPVSVAKTAVFVNGTIATVSSVDTGASTFTLSSAPAASANVVALVQTSDNI